MRNAMFGTPRRDHAETPVATDTAQSKIPATPWEYVRDVAPSGQSWASSPAVRAAFQGNRSKDTAPELAVRRLLHGRGFRYRVHCRPLSAERFRADLVFASQRLAVFIDGCYWHRCPQHFQAPLTHNEYWVLKIQSNVERDKAVTQALRGAGWHVLRFWEHQDPQACADVIADTVIARQNQPGEAARRRPRG